MFERNMSDACCEECGLGSNIEVSVEVESEKMRNSLMEGFPSIVSQTSLEAWERAIISASWLEAFLANGILWVKILRPAWMPVMAQPAALFAFEPSVKTQRVSLPTLEFSQSRCSLTRVFCLGLGQASGLMNKRPANGSEDSFREYGAFWV